MHTNKNAIGRLFKDVWNPKRPYAADAYAWGIFRMSREQALTKKHIQVNSERITSIICLDIDKSNTFDIISSLPEQIQPNVLVENPYNGHGHAMWLLAVPVTVSANGRFKPVEYLNAIRSSLTDLCQADRCYRGLICKNPIAQHWNSYCFTNHRYLLDELRDGLKSVNAMHSDYKRVPNLGLIASLNGRNDTLFEYGRKWAYRAVRDYLDSKDAFMDALVQYLRMRNQELRPHMKPLSDREVCGIAKSVCKWTWKSELRTKSQEDYDKTFSKIQKARSAKGHQKSIATRQRPYQDFVRQVNEDKSLLDKTLAQLAELFKKTERTIRRWLEKAKLSLTSISKTQSKLKRLSDRLNSYYSKQSDSYTDSLSASNTESDSQTHLSMGSISDLDKCQNYNLSEDAIVDKTTGELIEDSLEDEEYDLDEDFCVCEYCGATIYGQDDCECMQKAYCRDEDESADWLDFVWSQFGSGNKNLAAL